MARKEIDVMTARRTGPRTGGHRLITFDQTDVIETTLVPLPHGIRYARSLVWKK
jgi:hypothetical protein